MPSTLTLFIGVLAFLGTISQTASPNQAQVALEQPPTVQLDTYTGKPTHSFQLSGSGFGPGETVDAFLGSTPAPTPSDNTPTPLVSAAADDHGDVAARNVVIPMLPQGDYTLTLIGRTSKMPTSVGFNIQGFHPWVVLDNYYIAPHNGVGMSGMDFVPGEVVQVFLNTRQSQPVAQVTADSDGRFDVNNAFSLPDLTGDNQLIVVGQQSQTEVTATFAAAAPTPTGNYKTSIPAQGGPWPVAYNACSHGEPTWSR